jgi:GNAT superfamily N-acetyltransferase
MIRAYTHEDYPSVREIFWDTSTKTQFENQDEKDNFQKQYLDFYIDHSDFIGFVYEDNGFVEGYIIGLKIFDETLFTLHTIYKNFIELIKDYPSELHINLTGATRGKGVGSKLISEFENALETTGVFLLTSKHARNFHFYLKNHYECLKKLDNGVVFMGKSL